VAPWALGDPGQAMQCSLAAGCLGGTYDVAETVFMPRVGQYSDKSPLLSLKQSKSVCFDLGSRFHNIISAAAGFHGNQKTTRGAYKEEDC